MRSGRGASGPVGSPAVPVYALGDVETDLHPGVGVQPDAVVIGESHEVPAGAVDRAVQSSIHGGTRFPAELRRLGG